MVEQVNINIYESKIDKYILLFLNNIVSYILFISLLIFQIISKSIGYAIISNEIIGIIAISAILGIFFPLSTNAKILFNKDYILIYGYKKKYKFIISEIDRVTYRFVDDDKKSVNRFESIRVTVHLKNNDSYVFYLQKFLWYSARNIFSKIERIISDKYNLIIKSEYI